MSWLGNVLAFESFNLKDMLKRAAKNPDQLLLGAADPFSAKMWGKITGKKYEPLVNQWGGASDGAYERAEAAGINTNAGRQAHQVAQAIASIYAGGAAAGALGGGGGGAGAAAGGGGGGVAGSAGQGWGAFGPGGGAWTGTGALSGQTAAGGFGSLGLGAGATGNTAAAGWGAFGPGSSAWGQTGGGGLSFDQMMQMVQNMPQGQGQQDNQAPPPGGISAAPRGNGRLDPIAKGEVNYSRRRRKKSFLGG